MICIAWSFCPSLFSDSYNASCYCTIKVYYDYKPCSSRIPLKTPHSRGGESSHGRQWPIESDVNGLPSQPLGIDRSAGRITCGANKSLASVIMTANRW